MKGSTTALPPISDRSGVTDAVRAQILATEHWSLLATRSMTWNEVFSRATMFLTVLSAAVVALALVAQATGFGPGFRLFALLVLPIVLLVGIATVIRLGDANTDDFGLVVGMNRLRHAYLELAPELEPYFVAGHHDDEAGVMQSYGLSYRLSPSRVLAGTPNLVAAINVVVAGVLAALVADALGAPLDIVIPRKVGAPGNPELGLGAVADGVQVLDEGLISLLGVSGRYLEHEVRAQQEEIRRRTAAYRGTKPPPDLKGRVAVVVDDGVATGGTAAASLRWAASRGAAKVVLAVPVAPPQAVHRLRQEADEVVALATPDPFHAVGQWYAEFPQVSDQRVVALLSARAKTLGQTA